MELLNATKMPAEYTMGMSPDGREHLLVVVKGTFTIPEKDNEKPELTEEQIPLVMADEFTGEPGFSATLYESEFALFKPKCDVLLNGSAYAPQGEMAKHADVSLRMGPMNKSFRVIGNRIWDKILLSVVPSEPEPFDSLPISYDFAFGGVDVHPKNPEKKKAFSENPVGRGYYPLTSNKELIGKPLPNTEETHKPVRDRKGHYKPMSFGAMGRNVPQRLSYAGTYDQEWLDNVFPFLPADFDPRYYQAAPSDQQIDYPRGGEVVELTNLTPNGHTKFQLPDIEVPIEFTNDAYEHTEKQGVLDTILIEPDLNRFMLVWRASTPLKKSIFEMKQAIVGRMSRAWYRARETGKTYYPSLRHLVADHMGEPIEEEV